ncbi:hypothetical protein [Erythrobacter sp. HKB08]|uniref:hypothetical protein n=1 Tax=Erythrobacter sp. HKB08 TaxID=2502843 RepID=UPI00100887DC|nr:hypothetical protein [Erythrobacter sp. HKB08]
MIRSARSAALLLAGLALPLSGASGQDLTEDCRALQSLADPDSRHRASLEFQRDGTIDLLVRGKRFIRGFTNCEISGPENFNAIECELEFETGEEASAYLSDLARRLAPCTPEGLTARGENVISENYRIIEQHSASFLDKEGEDVIADLNIQRTVSSYGPRTTYDVQFKVEYD